MKIYTIENGTINEREVAGGPGALLEVLFESETFLTWKEAHAVLEERARVAVIDAEGEVTRACVRLVDAQGRYKSILNMKEPE